MTPAAGAKGGKGAGKGKDSPRAKCAADTKESWRSESPREAKGGRAKGDKAGKGEKGGKGGKTTPTAGAQLATAKATAEKAEADKIANDPAVSTTFFLDAFVFSFVPPPGI